MLPVSIVIPTYNRARLIREVLPSYLLQGCAEIVIVDDASNPQVQVESRDSATVTIIRTARRQQQPRSRMNGARHATQEFLFFGEDDAYLSPGCISSLLSWLERGTADIVAPQWITTRSLPSDPPRPPAGAPAWQTADVIDPTYFRIFCSDRIPQTPIPVPWLHTTALMRQRVVLELGFDPAYRGNAYREETDFYLRAHRSGIKLAYVPGPPAFHYKGSLNTGGGQHGRNLKSFLWYEYWVARNNYYFLRKHRRALELEGRRTHPFSETTHMMCSRMLHYPGRLLPEFRHFVSPDNRS